MQRGGRRKSPKRPRVWSCHFYKRFCVKSRVSRGPATRSGPAKGHGCAPQIAPPAKRLRPVRWSPTGSPLDRLRLSKSRRGVPCFRCTAGPMPCRRKSGGSAGFRKAGRDLTPEQTMARRTNAAAAVLAALAGGASARVTGRPRSTTRSTASSPSTTPRSHHSPPRPARRRSTHARPGRPDGHRDGRLASPVRQTIAIDQWTDAGGTGAALRVTPEQLTVKAPADVQAQVAGLLKVLREQRRRPFPTDSVPARRRTRTRSYATGHPVGYFLLRKSH